MLLRDFLLRIHLCKGIGIKGKGLIYQWAQQQSKWDDISAKKLCQVGHITKFRHQFSNSYNWLMQSPTTVNELVMGERWVCISDDSYPLKLKEGYEPPLILFYRGNWQLINTPSLAIVGSRKATNYSLKVLEKLLTPTICQKLTIVSGLADGVDSLAHYRSIYLQGSTIAVIGTGLDIFYPVKNKKLQQDIANNHLLISEYPNGTRGYRSHFPERNRIIAGITEALLVTEAAQHSGSLITANLALQNNRNVLAVPGSILSPVSIGTNELIEAGAKPILRPEAILEEFVS